MDSIKRRFSSSDAKAAQAQKLLEDQEKALKLIQDEIKVGTKTFIGMKPLTRENIIMLSNAHKLEFWDMEGRSVKGMIELNTPVTCLEFGPSRTLFRLEPENAKTVAMKMLEVWRYIGVDSVNIAVYQKATGSYEGEVKLGVLEAGKLGISGKKDLSGTMIFSVKGGTPSNIMPARDDVDQEVVARYGLMPIVKQTWESYDNFTSLKVDSLQSREEVYSLDAVLESSMTGEVTATASGNVDVSVNATKKKVIETKMEFTVKFLDDKHAGLLAMRRDYERESATKTHNKDEDARKAKEDAQKAKEDAERQSELDAKEKQCMNDLDTAFASYQMELNRDLERLVQSSWLFWETAPTQKQIFVVGLREAGKSTLVWSMSTLGKHSWEKMDEDDLAQTARRPLGSAEASLRTGKVLLNTLLPSKKVMTYAVDIQGEQHDVAGYSGNSNQLLVLVVPASKLFTQEGELVSDFEETYETLPYSKSASAIVVTKWDELKYGVASRPGEIMKNVDAFWNDATCVTFAEGCLTKLRKKVTPELFAFRMPIREEGNTRSYRTRYQMCCGVKGLMLFLISKMM